MAGQDSEPDLPPDNLVERIQSDAEKKLLESLKKLQDSIPKDLDARYPKHKVIIKQINEHFMNLFHVLICVEMTLILHTHI